VKTWKSSKDPMFAEKLRRLEELTNRQHNPPIVVSVDEMGPISLQPYGGHTWARSGHPDRVPATYKRLGGVHYLMGAYDYYHQRFRGYLSRRKTGADWVRFLRWVRSKYPSEGRIYLIQDNLFPPTPPRRRWRRPEGRGSPSPRPPPTPVTPTRSRPTSTRSVGGRSLERTTPTGVRSIGSSGIDPSTQPRPLRDQFTTRTPLVDAALGRSRRGSARFPDLGGPTRGRDQNHRPHFGRHGAMRG
jgi:hypothetical protein